MNATISMHEMDRDSRERASACRQRFANYGHILIMARLTPGCGGWARVLAVDVADLDKELAAGWRVIDFAEYDAEFDALTAAALFPDALPSA